MHRSVNAVLALSTAHTKPHYPRRNVGFGAETENKKEEDEMEISTHVSCQLLLEPAHAYKRINI